MAKFKPNYERQTLMTQSNREESIDSFRGYKLEWFANKVRKFAESVNTPVEDIKIIFDFGEDNEYHPYCTFHLVAERMETDDEMAKRIAREEARVATDQENARKSREQQERQDRNALEKLIARYGDDWVKNGGYPVHDDPPRE